MQIWRKNSRRLYHEMKLQISSVLSGIALTRHHFLIPRPVWKFVKIDPIFSDIFSAEFNYNTQFSSFWTLGYLLRAQNKIIRLIKRKGKQRHLFFILRGLHFYMLKWRDYGLYAKVKGQLCRAPCKWTKSSQFINLVPAPFLYSLAIKKIVQPKSDLCH